MGWQNHWFFERFGTVQRKLKGTIVSFSFSPAPCKQRKYEIQGAFSAQILDLLEQTYPMEIFQRCDQHLRGIPLEVSEG